MVRVTPFQISDWQGPVVAKLFLKFEQRVLRQVAMTIGVGTIGPSAGQPSAHRRSCLTMESSHAERLKLLRLRLCAHDRRTNPTVREKIADMVLQRDCLSWCLRLFRRSWLGEEAVLGAGASEQPDHLLAI
jgi:hypothetical protein